MNLIAILDLTESLRIVELFLFQLLRQLSLYTQVLVDVIATHPRTFFLLSCFVCTLWFCTFCGDEPNDDHQTVAVNVENKKKEWMSEICDRLRDVKEKNVLINVATLGEVTHHSAKSNKRYVSDFDLSITYYLSDDIEKNERNFQRFKAVKKYLSR